MRSYDFTPLLRTTVGFERMARALDTLADEPTNSFPPYNIESTGEDAYRITMAIAGCQLVSAWLSYAARIRASVSPTPVVASSVGSGVRQNDARRR